MIVTLALKVASTAAVLALVTGWAARQWYVAYIHMVDSFYRKLATTASITSSLLTVLAGAAFLVWLWGLRG